FDLERILVRALESERVARALSGRFRKEGERVAFPLSARRLGRQGTHRVEPVPGVALLVRVVAHHTVAAEHDVAVLLLLVVLHEEETVHAHARPRPSRRRSSGTPRRGIELLGASPRALERGELAVLLRRLRHSPRHRCSPFLPLGMHTAGACRRRLASLPLLLRSDQPRLQLRAGAWQAEGAGEECRADELRVLLQKTRGHDELSAALADAEIDVDAVALRFRGEGARP